MFGDVFFKLDIPNKDGRLQMVNVILEERSFYNSTRCKVCTFAERNSGNLNCSDSQVSLKEIIVLQ